MLAEIQKARAMLKLQIEDTYEDRMTVSELRNVKNPVTKKTEKSWVNVITDQPCKLSYSSGRPTKESENVANVEKEIKLFTSPSITVKVGSKIAVTKATGEITEYAQSGMPSMYASHQEINLNLWEKNA